MFQKRFKIGAFCNNIRPLLHWRVFHQITELQLNGPFTFYRFLLNLICYLERVLQRVSLRFFFELLYEVKIGWAKKCFSLLESYFSFEFAIVKPKNPLWLFDFCFLRKRKNRITRRSFEKKSPKRFSEKVRITLKSDGLLKRMTAPKETDTKQKLLAELVKPRESTKSGWMWSIYPLKISKKK